MSELAPILRFGSGDDAVDLSEYIISGSYSVTEAPVYDNTSSAAGYISAEGKELFTAVSGKKFFDTPTGEAPSENNRIVIGKSVTISAFLEEVPGEICAKAMQLAAKAVGTAKLPITYAAPLLNSAQFDFPTITAEIYNEADNTYNMQINASCPEIRFDGL